MVLLCLLGAYLLLQKARYFYYDHLAPTATLTLEDLTMMVDSNEDARIDPLAVCRNEIEILGHYAYPSSRCLVHAAGLLAEGKLPYKKLIKSFPLREYQQVLFGDKAGGVVKAAFKM